MVVPVHHVLILGAALFAVGVFGLLVKRNLIVLFLCVELILNAVNLTIIAFSVNQPLDAQVVVFFSMVLAAAEAAVGLALVIAIHRLKNTLDVDELTLMKD